MKKDVQKKIFGTDHRVVILGLARMADGIGSSFLVVVLPLYIASSNASGSLMGLSKELITGIIIAFLESLAVFANHSQVAFQTKPENEGYL